MPANLKTFVSELGLALNNDIQPISHDLIDQSQGEITSSQSHFEPDSSNQKPSYSDPEISRFLIFKKESIKV